MAPNDTVTKPRKTPRVAARPVEEVVEDSMRIYGHMTISGRAIPDIHDGMKPVYRRLLWAAYQSGLRPDRGYRKSAKLVGDTMGSYHPHGDVAIYGALETLVNLPFDLFDGQGNWGNPLGDPAAAMRYTECRLGTLAMNMLFDERYISVTPMISTYDGMSKEPVVLPSRLPGVLLMNTQGIAVGVITSFPGFTLASVEALIAKLFRRYAEQGRITEPSTKDLMHLEFECPGGGQVISEQSEIEEVFEKAMGSSLLWSCVYEVDEDENTVTITAVPPNWDVTRRIESMGNLPDVVHVANLSAAPKGGGPLKIRIEVKFRPGLSKPTFQAAVERLEKLLVTRISYRFNVIDQRLGSDDDGMPKIEASFHSMTLPQIIKKWAEWRVDLERRAALHELGVLDAALEKENALLSAVDHLAELFKIMQSSTITDKPAAIGKALSITIDMAKWLWSLPLSRFDRLKKDALDATIEELHKSRRQAVFDSKNPIQATAKRDFAPANKK